MDLMHRAKSGLLTHELDKQVVVYDPDGDRVHLLDSSTASVLKSLQHSGRAEPAHLFESAGEVKKEMYAIAVDELSRADLIDSPARLADVTRRDMLKRIAVMGGGALLVPAVISLTPGAVYAQSVCDARVNNGSSMCVSGTPCCATDSSGALIACKNDNMCYRITGEPCTNGNQCFSTMCVSNLCT
ncbi:MAG TPA: hypothetical protein VM166_15585 [Gemmatimonadaceae bacterium]|nr:hypothetical protein [Gemmatimonadaceae bacterium]